jgi:hypothetical protein
VLRNIPSLLTTASFESVFRKLSEKATDLAASGNRDLLNWLRHKTINPWIFQGLCFPLSNFSHEDWFTTSFTTNIAEAAHRRSQRLGVGMSLVGVILKSEECDQEFFKVRDNITKYGVSVRYGNQSLTGKTTKNLARRKGRSKKAQKISNLDDTNGNNPSSQNGNSITSDQVDNIIMKFTQSDAFRMLMDSKTSGNSDM